MKTTRSSDQNKKQRAKMIARYEPPGDWKFELRSVASTLLFLENPTKSLGSLEKRGQVVTRNTHIFLPYIETTRLVIIHFTGHSERIYHIPDKIKTATVSLIIFS